MTTSNATIGFWRRVVSLIYESLLLLAIWFIASFIFHLVFRDPTAVYFRPLFQFYLLVVTGYYFTWFWTRGGQTLAMQTWKMRVITVDGYRLKMRQAMARYLLAVSGTLFPGVASAIFFFWVSGGNMALGVAGGILFSGLGFLWAFFDRDHQYLHDRLAGTQIVKVEESASNAGGPNPKKLS